jgi:hypothetical protein
MAGAKRYFAEHAQSVIQVPVFCRRNPYSAQRLLADRGCCSRVYACAGTGCSGRRAGRSSSGARSGRRVALGPAREAAGPERRCPRTRLANYPGARCTGAAGRNQRPSGGAPGLVQWCSWPGAYRRHGCGPNDRQPHCQPRDRPLVSHLPPDLAVGRRAIRRWRACSTGTRQARTLMASRSDPLLAGAVDVIHAESFSTECCGSGVHRGLMPHLGSSGNFEKLPVQGPIQLPSPGPNTNDLATDHSDTTDKI